MGLVAVTGAMVSCMMGIGFAPLTVTSQNKVTIEGKPVATIKDFVLGINYPPIGMCMSLANPAVAAATAIRLGVLTPMPCTCIPVGMWRPSNPALKIGTTPCLCQGASLQCAYAGQLSILSAGQTKVNG